MTEPSLTSNAYLTVQQTGQTFPLPLGQELLTIGRKSGNSIMLADDIKVSRHHATIFCQPTCSAYGNRTIWRHEISRRIGKPSR